MSFLTTLPNLTRTELVDGRHEPCWSIAMEMGMPRHRVSVTFSLSAKQVELLDRLAERTNVPKSVYVRKGVDVILRKYRGVLQGTEAPRGREDEEQ